MYCKGILNTLICTACRQTYELVMKVGLVIYVFLRRLNLGKHVTVIVSIVSLSVTNKGYQQLFSNFYGRYFQHQNTYETNNTQMIN